jgi:hypothetical protein
VFAVTQSSIFDTNAAAGLQISPALVELNGEPGKSYVLKEKVTNVTNSDLNYTTTVDDFGAKDESGAAKLLPRGDVPVSASMIGWVAAPASFTLVGKEVRTLSITVTIPQNAEPGGHYGVLSFQGTKPKTSQNSVAIQASTGLLMLVRVAGTVDEDLQLTTLSSEKDGKQSSIFENTPITFVTRLQNKGNIHVKPSGTITITDMFGRLVDTLKVNNDLSNVLPNSIRRFESTLTKDWMFGRYSAELTIGYGTKGQVVQGQIMFWVIPWKIVATILLVLVTLIFIVWRMIKVYNRHIINKYKQTNEKQTKKPKKHKD